MSVAIVTGASSGIGAEFCRALDSKGLDSIWLVARRRERLESLAETMRTPCVVVEADLSDASGVVRLRGLLDSERPEIKYLVNSAGFARFGNSWEIRSDDTRSIIALNCAALAEVTCMCIPYMSSGSSIIEMCSASAYLPLKTLNVYAASKSFVRSFCNGLRREVECRGIRVLEVSPGWVETDFISQCGGADVPSRVFWHKVDPTDVVTQAFKDLDRGRRRSVCGTYNRFQVFVCAHLPSVAVRVWDRSLK